MADEQQKLVKVRLLHSVNGGAPGDVIEVPEQQAKHMTSVRELHTGSGLQNFQVAEYADSGTELKSAAGVAHMTVKDMADIGLKNVVEAPKTLSVGAEGVAMPRLSTTTNESIPHATGAPMASVAASSAEEDDQSSNEESAGYDGANIMSHSREGSKSSKPSKGQKSGTAGQNGQAQPSTDNNSQGGVGNKLKDAAHKLTGK